MTLNRQPFRWVGWILTALSVAAMLWSTQPWGAGITVDSVGFIRNAWSLSEGQGWHGYSALYPPLLSLLLAPFPLFGIEPQVGGRYLEVGLYATILVAAWHWMLSYLKTRIAALIGLLSLASSGAMVESAGLLLTETPFMAMMTLALVAADRYWRNGALTWLLTFALFCALASSLRYVGVTLVMAGGLLILLRPALPFWGRIKHLIVFGATSASLTLIWLARSWFEFGTLTGC